MNPVASDATACPLTLRAETAKDLMSKAPLSIHQSATLVEAASFLIEKEISAAPVIGIAGRAVGVLSLSDIVRHNSKIADAKPDANEFYHVVDLFCPPALRSIVHPVKPEHVQVCDIMTPTVLSVTPDDSVVTVVAELLAMKVHRLFVVDHSGVLVGVISVFDMLRKLRA